MTLFLLFALIASILFSLYVIVRLLKDRDEVQAGKDMWLKRYREMAEENIRLRARLRHHDRPGKVTP